MSKFAPSKRISTPLQTSQTFHTSVKEHGGTAGIGLAAKEYIVKSLYDISLTHQIFYLIYLKYFLNKDLYVCPRKIE